MKRLLTSILTATVLLIGVAASAQSTDVKGAKARPENMAKYTLPSKDVVAAKPDNSRGSCCLNFDNWTGYIIYVWVDGDYRGTVSPWDEGSICVGDGWTTFYARTAGGTYEWSSEGQCMGYFNIKLD